MIGYHTNTPNSRLGMYGTPDYRCAATGGGNFVCQGTRPDVSEAYAALQQTVKTIASKMATGGRLNVPADLTVIAVDGQIGKITSIGVQFIGAAFAAVKAPPPDVANAITPGLGSPDEVVERIAAAAVEINAYFIHVLTNFPAAITQETAAPKGKWGIVVASVGALALVGVAVFLSRQMDDDEENRWF